VKKHNRTLSKLVRNHTSILYHLTFDNTTKSVILYRSHQQRCDKTCIYEEPNWIPLFICTATDF